MPVRFRHTLGPLFSASALTASIVLTVLAMEAYPGGNAWDVHSQRHDFWQNTLCDLLRTTAINGRTNASGSRLECFAMLSFAAWTFASWWSVAATLSCTSSLRFATRGLGALSSVGLALVALLPTDRFHEVHPLLMALAGLPGLAAGACTLYALAGAARYEALVLGAAALCVGMIDLGWYLSELGTSVEGSRAVAALERVTVILGIVWVATTKRSLALTR
jgi:hypothetical protein